MAGAGRIAAGARARGRWLLLAGLVALSVSPVARAQADTPGLMVVYGAATPSREGDVDLREQVFFSVPADMADRLHVRLYDPEVHGGSDFAPGGTARSRTVFRLFGGAGAYSEADRPVPVEDGARVPARPDVTPVTGPGVLLAEESWGNDPATDGRWVGLAAVQAGQGEIIGDRAWFRIDAQGAGGDDGNGFSLAVSLAGAANHPPEGLEMISFRPTVRWTRGQPATLVPFDGPGDGAITVQSFDAANGSITVATRFADLPVRVSGQDFWASDVVETDETDLAITLLDGFETPNDVTLAVFDDRGRVIPLRMPPIQAPDPMRPVLRAVARPLADCRSVAFDASASQGRGALAFAWHFGDGDGADAPVVVHRYDGPGRHVARIEITEPGNRPGRGAALELPVHLRNAPVAVPGSDVIVAPGQPVAFDGTGSVASDSPITRWTWIFGDGTGAAGARAQKTYDTPGLYRAVLRVEDDSDHPCNVGVETRRIVVNAPPVAEAGTDQAGAAGQPVILSGAASYDVDGNIATYSWDMGDGSVLEGQTVTHAYATPGLYTVTLRVRDDSGVANDHSSDSLRVTVNAPPEPRFDGPPRALSVSEITRLDAGASADPDGAILSWIWDFGDGRSGEGRIVDYAWDAPGRYDVTLTVIDDSATGSAMQSVTRTIVVDAPPVAEAGPDRQVTASELRFDGSGSSDPDGAVADWAWDFGDGQARQGRVVDHAYARPGVYDVTLTVRDDSGAPLNIARDRLRVTINAAPIADAGPDQVVAPGEPIAVSARGSVDPDGAIAAYHWQLPGDHSAEGADQTLTLDAPGLYRLGLTVRDDFAADPAEARDEMLVTVNAPPVAQAGPDRRVAPGEPVVFDGSQSFDPDGQITGWRWDFEDIGTPLEAMRVERAYDMPGDWAVRLQVTDDSGVANGQAADGLTVRVNHAPVAEAGPDVVTDGLIVTLDGSASLDRDGDALVHAWDFGDGSPPGYGAEVTHVYDAPGEYAVTLQVDDGTGLANGRAADTTSVTIHARPLADAGGNRAVCSGEPVIFDASASRDPGGGALTYAWEFGDGTRSDHVAPAKTYDAPGIYAVTLRVDTGRGGARAGATDRIAALVRDRPRAEAGPDRTVCTNQLVRFDGTASRDADGTVDAFAWDFGDGQAGRGPEPVHVYDQPGDYLVTLDVTGAAQGSCSTRDSDTARVRVFAAPRQRIEGEARAAAGQPASFRAGLEGLDGATPVAHRWTLSNGAEGEGETFTHVFDMPGDYLVTLVTDLTGGNAGCATVETTRRVVVNAAPRPVIRAPDLVAAGQEVVFDAGASADPDGAITAFAWDFGDGQVGEGVEVSHVYDRPGAYDVQLVVVDDAGVGNSVVAALSPILVNPAPLARLPVPPVICPGDSLPWEIGADASTAVRWDFGDGTRAEGRRAEHGYDRPGLYPVVVTLDDATGLANGRRSAQSYVRVNRAPQAMAGPDRVICPGDSVTFDAGLSGDADGALTGWTWAFSDGVQMEGRQVSRSFDVPGEIGVQLSVTDDSGSSCATGVDTARVRVNAPPVVDAGPDRETRVGGAHDGLVLDATGAVDPDGPGAGQGLHIRWDFGDGTGGEGMALRHAYDAPGEYEVVVTASDASGLACGVATDRAVVTALPRDGAGR